MYTNIDLLLESRHAAVENNKMKVLLVWRKGKMDIE